MADSSLDPNANRGPRIVLISILFTALAALFVFLRLWTRLGMVRNTGPDDWIITGSLALSVTLTVLIWDQVHYGMGHHYKTLPPEQYIKSLKPFYISVPVYNLALTATKISICFQYLRVFPSRATRRTIFVTGTIIGVYGAWTFFGSVFMCWPIAFFWDKSIEGRCLDQMAYWFSNAAMNIVTDLVIIVLPIPVLNRLNLPKRQKYGLICIFGVGIFIVVVSCLRLQSLYTISVSTDITWDNPPAAMWSSIETNVAIICACLPTLKALVAKIFPRFLSSSNSHGGGYLSRTSQRQRRSLGANRLRSSRSGSRHLEGGDPMRGSVRESGIADGRQGPQRSVVKSSASGGEEGAYGLKDFEPGQRAGIKVVTVIAQDVKTRGDGESQRGLVWKDIGIGR